MCVTQEPRLIDRKREREREIEEGMRKKPIIAKEKRETFFLPLVHVKCCIIRLYLIPLPTHAWTSAPTTHSLLLG